MKRILLLLIIFQFSVSLSFSQEEIWGYHSLAGSEGGGMVFRVDPDTKEVETIHRFGHGINNISSPDNPVFMHNGNSKLYGFTKYSVNGNASKSLYSYDPLSKEVDFLIDLQSSVQFSAIDSNYIYFTSLLQGGNSTYVYAYDITANTIERIMIIPNEKGNSLQGLWMKQANGLYYSFAGNGGASHKGSIIEIDVVNRESTVIIHFDVDRYPKGSLLTSSELLIYGTMSRGKTNNLGSIISLDPKKREEYNVMAVFNDTTGGVPFGEMIIANDACFYGATNVKGEYDDGTFYKFNPADNSLVSIYQINDDSEEFYQHEFSGYFSQLSDNKLVGVLESKEEQGAGKIFSLDLISHELEILVDFSETDISLPIGQLTLYNEQFFGVVQSDTASDKGGVFSFDALNQQSIFEKSFSIYEFAENGQNPNWMCQADNGNVYGMTYYGGKENKGIVFEIDYFSKELSKKMDVVDVGFPINPYPESFAMAPGVIVGLSKVWISKDSSTAEKNEYETSIFEYNYINNSLTKKLILPTNYYKGIRMNKDGDLYFNDRTTFYEYAYQDNELSVHHFPDTIPVIDIVEYNAGNYIGSSSAGGSEGFDWFYGMLFSWNKSTNEIIREFDMIRFFPSGGSPAHPRNRLFCSAEGLVYGDFMTSEIIKPSWEESYVFDMESDSLLQIDPLYNDFNDHRRYALIETFNSKYLIRNISQGGSSIGKIGIYESAIDTQYYVELEDAPYYYDYYGDGDYETDATFDFIDKVDLINVKNMDAVAYWTGVKDSAWYQEKNWYGSKQPSEDVEIIIPNHMLNYPVIDTIVITGKITIQNQANIQLNPNASLSCQSILNEGELKLYTNDIARASLISSDSIINKGNISYSYLATDSGRVVLGSPIKNVKLDDLDSIPVWEFDGYEWLSLQNPNAILNSLQGYNFALDSAQELKFSGEFNYGNISYNFLSNSNMLDVMANPYPSSFDWSKLDLSLMDNQALYKFNNTDSSFTSYIDGLGSASPLILPLEAFMINSNGLEQFELNNSQRMHAVDFKLDSTYEKTKLSIKAEGKDGSDLTHISFNHLATAAFDGKYDALKFLIANTARPQIFTFAGEDILSINQLPDTAMMDIAVQAGKDATFTISIDKNLGFDFVILEDLIWKKQTDLLKQDYSFDYLASDSVYLFKLYFKPWSIQPVNETDIEIYYYPESIVVRSRKQIDFAYITFYDLAGRVALELQAEEFHHFEKPISLPVGHYIVQVRAGDLIANRKILVRR